MSIANSVGNGILRQKLVHLRRKTPSQTSDYLVVARRIGSGGRSPKPSFLARSHIKQKMAGRYNKSVVPRDFEIGDLVLRRADVGRKNARQGKLAPKWEDPYCVIAKTGVGAYYMFQILIVETVKHY